MRITNENFANSPYLFKENDDNSLRLIPHDNDIGGGVITKQEIDALEAYDGLEYLMISGLKQDTFEYFIQNYARNLRGIVFFKNKLVEDWSLLSTLTSLEYIFYFHNQRITKLWDMSNNTNLKGIIIRDFTRLHSLDGIQKAKNLEYFEVGNAVWDSMVVDSYQYFENSNVQILGFSGKKIEDEDFSFFEKMPQLKQFNSSLHLLTREQIAWVVSNFPHINGYSLCSYVPFENANREIELFITGKRMPHLKQDDLRVKRYDEKFEVLLKKYKGLSYQQLFTKEDSSK